MTEPAETGSTPSDITRLLLKAVKELPEDEQRAVFEYFFERGIATPQDPRFGRFVAEEADFREAASSRGVRLRLPLAELFAGQTPVGPDQVMIPVRLSQAQHRRLKQWCAENSFPMAVVVRGLIDRFLDSREKRSS